MANNRKKGEPLPAPRSMEERAKCRELYESGLSYKEISEETNVPRQTLAVWRKRENWTREPQSQIAISDADADEEIPDTLHERQDEYSERMQRAAIKLSRHVSKLDGEALVKHSDKILKADKTSRAALKLEADRPATVIQLGVLCAPVGRRPGEKKLIELDSNPETLTLSGPDEQ